MIKIVLLLVLVLVAQGNKPPYQPLQIIYVSGSPTSISRPAYSSTVGGTMIYMKVTGHSRMASENSVLVGGFPCIIPADGVTDTFISCETSSTGSGNDLYGQTVTLYSNKQKFTTLYPNVVNYGYYYTPLLEGVYPTAAIPGASVHLLGYHRITNLGDGFRDIGQVSKLTIGRDVCNTFDVKQGPISAHGL